MILGKEASKREANEPGRWRMRGSRPAPLAMVAAICFLAASAVSMETPSFSYEMDMHAPEGVKRLVMAAWTPHSRGTDYTASED